MAAAVFGDGLCDRVLQLVIPRVETKDDSEASVGARDRKCRFGREGKTSDVVR